jgi:hypothetical protein
MPTSTPTTSSVLSPFHQPSTVEYASATSTFNVLAALEPDAAVVARSTADVVAAVATARRRGLDLAVYTTGHAAKGLPSLAGALLVRVAFDAAVTVDPERRVATIPAGSQWGDVVALAAQHGLAAMHGSSATVGAIGYLLRGGLSFYGRLHGVASNSLRSVTIVTFDGSVVRADAETEPDLFWAVRGGGGGFGIVVEVEIDLLPMWQIITGFTAWDARDADRIAPLWREWTATAPREATTSLRLMNLPPLPEIPDALKNGQILVLDGAVSVTTQADLERGNDIAADLLDALRQTAAPVMDTWHIGSPLDLPATHMDPQDPMPYLSDHFIVGGFDDAAMTEWLSAAGPESGSALTSAELRQLGGAFSDENPGGGALDAIGGQFAAFNVGVPMGLATPGVVLAHQQRIRESLARYDTGFTAPTFVEELDSRHRALPASVQDRVDSVRRRFDPAGMFERDVVRATIE